MTDRRGIAPPAPSVVVAQISETKSFFTSLSSPLGDVAFLLYFLVLALFLHSSVGPITGLTFIFIITCPLIGLSISASRYSYNSPFIKPHSIFRKNPFLSGTVTAGGYRREVQHPGLSAKVARSFCEILQSYCKTILKTLSLKPLGCSCVAQIITSRTAPEGAGM